MSSTSVPNSVTTNSNDIVDDLVLNIENLIQDFQALPNNSDEAVCVYRVPESLRSARPEAFTPQFVGLGPYHHRRPEVIPREILKVAAATRVLNYFNQIPLKELVEKLRILNLAPFIRDCYDGSIESNDFTLLYLMTVDALFLCELLRILDDQKQSSDGIVTEFNLPDSILTRKLGMPLVNTAGVELTKDVLIREVFMLENQIPTCILKQIITLPTTSMETEEPHVYVNVDDEKVGSKMLAFCRAFCPLLKIQQLPNNSEAVKRVHLLDLMYHLIVPETKSKPNPETMDKQPEKTDVKSRTCCYIVVPPLIFSYVLVFYILDLMSWVVDMIYNPIVQLVKLIFRSPAVDKLHECLNGIPALRPLAIVVGGIKGAGKLLVSPNSDVSDACLAVTIASVTQLHKAGIHCKSADGGITCIKFDKGIFFLPEIRVDVNSEVIIRNLVAYESLAKSNHLIFTRYVQLMRAIIDTADDVKLLVHEQIIQTKLSHEQVAQLFNGPSKSIRPTNTPELDQVIKKVNAEFHSTNGQKLHRIYTTYVRILFKWSVVYAVLIFLVLMAMQAYCFVFSCSRTSKFDKLPEDEYDYRNSSFINSM